MKALRSLHEVPPKTEFQSILEMKRLLVASEVARGSRLELVSPLGGESW